MKSIYELTDKEGRKLDKELKKSRFCNQYLISTVSSICFVFLASVGFVCGYAFGNEGKGFDIPTEAIFLAWVIFVAVVSIMILLLNFKRFDLLKNYYDEVYSKKENK